MGATHQHLAMRMSLTSIPSDEIARLRKLLAFLYENFFKTEASPDSVHPLNVLDRNSSGNPELAIEMLLSGIDTLFIGLDHKPVEHRKDLDQKLIAVGAMSEYEYKARYGKSVKKILKRGHVANRREYDLVRSLVDRAEGSDVPSYIHTLQCLLNHYVTAGVHHKD